MGIYYFEQSDENKALRQSNNRADALQKALKESFRNFELTRQKVPQGFDLLNATGKNFKRFQHAFGYQLLKYEKELIGRCGEFIQEGLKGSGSKVVRPVDRIGFFSKGWSTKKPNVTYKFNQDKKAIYIDTEIPCKGETFVRAALERCAFNGYAPSPGGGHIIAKNGFSTSEFDSQDKLVKTTHKGIHDGLMLALTEDIVISVTWMKPRLITEPGHYCKHPQELMSVARFVRDFVNTTNLAKGKYNIQNDALMYDCFVNGEISETRKVMDLKCVPGTFDLLSDHVEKLINLEKGEEFDKTYAEIKKMINWMEKAQKESK